MKKFFLAACFVTSCFADTSLLQTLTQKGLDAKVSVCVMDQNRHPVSNADVRFSFSFSTDKKPYVIETKTDHCGIATAQSKTNSRISIHIEKEGYYRTRYKYSVWKGSGGYENGRWEPWNPMINLTLRKKIMPQNLNVKSRSFHRLKPFQTYAFDFLTGTLCPNENTTNTPDLVFSALGSFYLNNTTTYDDFTATNRFMFLSKECGFIERKKHQTSSLKYDYQAPVDGYVSKCEFVYEQKNRIANEIKRFHSETNEYLIFRIVRLRENGEEQYYYGVIESWNIGKDWKSGEINFFIRYRINPEPGDRNIEYIQ